MPKVSIMVLTKDRPVLLKRALNSIAMQTFRDFEVVIGNCSVDQDTTEVIAHAEQNGLLIRHIRQDARTSITACRQQLLEASLGEYIAPLDDDDCWCDSEKLHKQISYLQNNPAVVLLGGAMRRVTTEGQVLGLTQRPETDRTLRNSMLLRNNFATSVVMFHKASALQAGGFEFFENDLAEDYLLWLKLGQSGSMHSLPDVLVNYRVTRYSKEKKLGFFIKQRHLIAKFKQSYPNYWIARIILGIRIAVYFLTP